MRHSNTSVTVKCRPAHIQTASHSVPVPDLSSLLLASCHFGPTSTDSPRCFIAQCQLSQLVSQLQSDICLYSSDSLPAEQRERIVNKAIADADVILKQWQHYLSSTSPPRPTGVPNLIIMILGFRALLKRISVHLDPFSLEDLLGPTITANAGTLEYLADIVNFVGVMTKEDVDGFFFVCEWNCRHVNGQIAYQLFTDSRHILLATMSCLIRLAMSQVQGSIELLCQFTKCLRHFCTEYNWDLGQMCLDRATGVQARLLQTGEFLDVCAALSGDMPSSDPNTLPEIDPNTIAWDTRSALTLNEQFPWDWTCLDFNIGEVLNLPD